MSRALMELHWLLVDKRIEYKLLLYTYKALHGLVNMDPEVLLGHLRIYGTLEGERGLPGLRIVCREF